LLKQAMMCKYDALYHNDSTGYVVRCKDCDKIQIGYGNIMLTVNYEGFDAFRWWLKHILEEQDPAQKETLRCITVPTPCDGVKLLLCRRELKEFDEMLEEADTELKSTSLLNLFSNQ
jgi:hypothetical protein